MVAPSSSLPSAMSTLLTFTLVLLSSISITPSFIRRKTSEKKASARAGSASVSPSGVFTSEYKYSGYISSSR